MKYVITNLTFFFLAQFDQGGLGLKDFSDYEDESKPLVVAYKKYMATIAGLLLNESNQYDPEKINEFVNLTFQFEKNLAKVIFHFFTFFFYIG